MADRMIEAFNPAMVPGEIESAMRAELTHADAQVATVVPIMRHLVTNDDSSIFSEEIVARTRAMIEDLARQLLVARAEAAGLENPYDCSLEALGDMAGLVAADPALLAYVHALAIEWQLTDRLNARLGLDPVLSPLLQALIASSEAETAASAMNLLAAQARFAQSQRRMQLALAELPADLLHTSLLAMRQHAGEEDDAAIRAEQLICDRFDESRSRLGLLAQLVLGMGGGAHAALSLEHAGTAMFLTALAIATGQDRGVIALSTSEGQATRLLLALSAAGLKPQAIEEQFVTLHPDISPPAGISVLGQDRAAAILSRTTGYSG